MAVIDLSKLPFPDNDLEKFLDSVCETHELDFAAYAGMNPVTQTVHGFVNYPQEWQTHYVNQNYVNRDPTLLLAKRSIAPVDWQRLRQEPSFDMVFSDAHDFGISDQGLTIPVRGPFGDIGLFSVTRKCSAHDWALLKAKILGDLQQAAVHLHDHVIQSEALSSVLGPPALSAREIEILQWTAAGKSQQDTADILSISHRTIEVHLRSAREKLGALTTAQAIGRAISRGLIYPA
ncbi:autoinducer binding domain-containing protein [Pontibaca salina]|uniref:Autoinducer binding domain-containing protein n=1 Tax=Pontibaca salina TaxID=2795731 RepID=A0A934M0A4_9RHOB|nr:autoinducer binding domain-containing protein [Pontibaca salina]MBI6629548.1 autoinducer binding domain-containing protein [Pontibaca salina]